MAAPQQPLPEGRPAAPPAKGDEADLFAAYHQRLVGQLAGHLGGQRELAAEAAGFAWLQLLRYQPDRHYVEGWLFTVVIRTFETEARRERKLRLSGAGSDERPGPAN
jgi:DNA-directed RNA polymerase specialized sigma24 family protein